MENFIRNLSWFLYALIHGLFGGNFYVVGEFFGRGLLHVLCNNSVIFMPIYIFYTTLSAYSVDAKLC